MLVVRGETLHDLQETPRAPHCVVPRVGEPEPEMERLEAGTPAAGATEGPAP